MAQVECPWCAGPATIEIADGDEFCCAACSVRVEIVGMTTTDTLAVVAIAA